MLATRFATKSTANTTKADPAEAGLRKSSSLRGEPILMIRGQ